MNLEIWAPGTLKKSITMDTMAISVTVILTWNVKNVTAMERTTPAPASGEKSNAHMNQRNARYSLKTSLVVTAI